MKLTVGIDLGGTNIKSVLMDEAGTCLADRTTATHAEQGVDRVLDRICGIVRELAKPYESLVEVLGVTAPAVVRLPEGCVELMPNFPDAWAGFPLREKLEDRLRIPVYLLNDARAATYAEKRFGVGRTFHDFLYVTLGTGVGGGVVVGDRLIVGSRGVAGEIGHTTVEPGGAYCGCGNRGCLETVASGPAIVSAAVRVIRQGFPTIMREMCAGDMNRVTPELVTEAAGEGDEHAQRILTDVAERIAGVLRNLISLLNPEAIIIGGGVGTSKLLVHLVDHALRRLPTVFPDDLGSVQVLQAAGHSLSGALGAAAWAREMFDASAADGSGWQTGS